MAMLGQSIVNGLLIGGIYALIAVGLTMIFGVMKIVNFAQGEFVMLGLYLTIMLAKAMATGIPYLLIVPVAAIMFAFGCGLFRIVVYPVVGKGNTSYILLTMGLSYFFQNVAQMIWSPNPISLDGPLRTASYMYNDVAIMKARFFAFIIATILVFIMNAFLNKTDIGRAMRATSEDTVVSKMLGINTKKMFTIAFGMGTMFAAVAGGVLSPIYAAYPRVGVVFGTTVYACVVIGGLGNIRGAFIGSFVIGLIETFAGTYIAVNLAPTCVFIILMLCMLFKPQGFFGGGGRQI